MAFPTHTSDPLARVQGFWDFVSTEAVETSAYYDSNLYRHIKPLSSTANPDSRTALTTFSLTVPQSFCNRMNNLHGGAAATIFDLLTTVALAPVSEPGKFEYAGVSRTLNCTYLKAVKCGRRVRVECEVVNLGRRLCSMRGVMRAVGEGKGWLEEGVGSGEVLALCEHGKVSVDPVKEKL